MFLSLRSLVSGLKFCTKYYVLCTLLFWAFPLSAQEPSRDEFLDLVQRQTFEFFRQESNPYNGLVRDSAPNREGSVGNAPASIAGTGFALTAYPVAVERGWMSRQAASTLTVRTLEFFLRQAPQQRGFFYHYLHFENGQRANQSEISPIDTALFLAGALFAAEYLRTTG